MEVLLDIYRKCKTQAKQYNINIACVLFDYLYSRIRFGFCGEDYFRNSTGYAMKNFQKKSFFSYQKWFKIMDIFNDKEYTHLLSNKVEFLNYFQDFITHSHIYPKNVSFEKFEKYVTSHPNLLMKPLDENQGHGIERYIPSGNLKDDYNSLAQNNYFIEEKIQQHHKMNLGSQSVNTIRVYTILDGQGHASILKAVLRVGVGDSIIDNYHAGGVIYPINIEFGFVEGYGVSRVFGKKICIHPGTSQLMVGYKLPNWDILCSTMVKAAECIPQVRYIGWDVVITEDGVDFIEANHDADHALFEVIGSERLFYNRLLSFK